MGKIITKHYDKGQRVLILRSEDKLCPTCRHHTFGPWKAREGIVFDYKIHIESTKNQISYHVEDGHESNDDYWTDECQVFVSLEKATQALAEWNGKDV